MTELIEWLIEKGLNKEATLDGEIYRFDANSPNSGWYWGIGGKAPSGKEYCIGFIGDWNGGRKESFKTSTKYSPSDRKYIKEKTLEMKALQEAQLKENHDRVALEVSKIWQSLSVHGTSPYLERKGISEVKGLDIRFDQNGNIQVPVGDFNQIWSLEQIDPSGKKKFFFQGRVKGNFFAVGPLESETYYLCEGFATAVSVHLATGQTALHCFGNSNVERVLLQFADHFSSANFVICADDDSHKPQNTGQKLFKLQSDKVRVVIPAFKDQRDQTDFNDLMVSEGIEVVRKQLLDISVESYPTKADGFFMITENSRGEPRETPDFTGFRDYMQKVRHFRSNDSFSYIYENGYYRSVSPLHLEYIVQGLIKSNTAPFRIAEFAKAARVNSFRPAEDFHDAPGHLNLGNGVLDVKTRQLKPHSPDLFFKYKLTQAYDPKADCPKFRQALFKILGGDTQLIALVQEMFGYILLGGDPWLHKAFVLYGEGRNGKSVVLDVLKALIGENNYSSVALKNLEKPFSAIMADGKLANIVGECTVDQLASDIFKTCVGGEPMIAAQKNQPEYKFNFTARLIFAANDFPKFKDQTSGMHEKLCIIPFNHYIHQKDRERSFSKQFLPELSGVLTWAIEGLTRLEKTGHLSDAKAVDEVFTDYRKESDSVYEWMCDYVKLEATSQERYVVGSFFDHYVSFCDESGRHPVTKNVFSRRIMSDLRKQPTIETTTQGNKTVIKKGILITAKAGQSKVSRDYAQKPKWDQ